MQRTKAIFIKHALRLCKMVSIKLIAVNINRQWINLKMMMAPLSSTFTHAMRKQPVFPKMPLLSVSIKAILRWLS